MCIPILIKLNNKNELFLLYAILNTLFNVFIKGIIKGIPNLILHFLDNIQRKQFID